MEKICPRCNELKEHNLRKSGGPQSYCIDCNREYNRSYYKDNKNVDNKRRQENRKEYNKRVLELVNSLKNVPCMDCGVKYPPYVMDFDHKNETSKIGNIGTMKLRVSIAKLLEEIEKCDVVCANCHRIRTHKRRLDITQFG